MKKLLVVLMSLMLILSFVGCNNNAQDGIATPTETASVRSIKVG